MNEDLRKTIIAWLVREGPPCNFWYELPDDRIIQVCARWPEDRHCIGWEYNDDILQNATDEELIGILFSSIVAWEHWYVDIVNEKYDVKP